MLVLQCMHVEVLNYADVRIFREKTPRKTPKLGGESPPKTPENGVKIKQGCHQNPKTPKTPELSLKKYLAP